MTKYGEIKSISLRTKSGKLYDQSGELRWFDRGELDANENIKPHDIVTYELDHKNCIRNISLYKRHGRSKVVFHFK